MGGHSNRSKRPVSGTSDSTWVARQEEDGVEPYPYSDFTGAQERLDFRGWIPWCEIKSVLCIATAGGRESALFASLGCQVTVCGSPPLQLQLDRTVAHQNGFKIESVDCDMLDIGGSLHQSFDLVYQGVSAHHLACTRRLYQGVHNLLRLGGYYWVEHRSPYGMQLAAMGAWDGQAYRLAEPQQPQRPLPVILRKTPSVNAPRVYWQHIHSLNELIGGFCDCGFTLLAFAERGCNGHNAAPGSRAHRAAYIPPFLVLFGQRGPA